MEYVVILLKPGFLHLSGLVKQELQNLGLVLESSKLIFITEDVARYWRESVRTKPYFEEMIEYHLSGQCFAMLWSGMSALDTALNYRGMYSEETKTGFRGKHGESPLRNAIHVSTKNEIVRDIEIFFPEYAKV